MSTQPSGLGPSIRSLQEPFCLPWNTEHLRNECVVADVEMVDCNLRACSKRRICKT